MELATKFFQIGRGFPEGGGDIAGEAHTVHDRANRLDENNARNRMDGSYCNQ